VDKYLWLQLIGLGPLFPPSAMVLEACVSRIRSVETTGITDEGKASPGVIDRGGAVARRGDTDALPITEDTPFPYKR